MQRRRPGGNARLFDRYQFASVLDCAATAPEGVRARPGLARRINVEGVGNLALADRPRRLRLVHLSVDLVFSGDREGGYVEDDPTDPVTIYGKTMAEGERWLLESDPGRCILRISLPMGVSFNGHAGAIDWITSRFRKSRPATLYIDEVRTPTYTDCLNPLYEWLLADGLSGVYHAGGPRRLTLYQIAQIINRGAATIRGFCWAFRGAGRDRCRPGRQRRDAERQIGPRPRCNPFDPWPWTKARADRSPLASRSRARGPRLGQVSLPPALHEFGPPQRPARFTFALAALRLVADP